MEDRYPVIGQLEQITFGSARPQMPIEERLTQLEQTIFHQTYPQLSLFDRSQKLRDTLLGPRVDPDIPPPRIQARPPVQPPLPEPPAGENLPLPDVPGQSAPEAPPEALWSQPFFQEELTRSELERYALELVNEDRHQLGLHPLEWDDTAAHVAREQVEDLARRNTVSHLNSKGLNPDQRYTTAGGNDALLENLAAIPSDLAPKDNRALVARAIFIMKGRQDDRDALLSPDATHFGFSIGRTHNKQYVVACAEVITKHAIMHPIPHEIKVGEKIEVKGVILQPYRFQRLTLAWEGLPDKPPADPEEVSTEAMPYFPPLDFVAYAQKAEKDWEKTKAILRTVGVMAAIAGGMFVPPVALAAPLIAMAGTGGEAKAAPDIPVRGGIKLEGALFQGNVPVDNNGKEGLYYITVWAASPEAKPVPVSRRTVVAKTDKVEDANREPQRKEKQEKQEK